MVVQTHLEQYLPRLSARHPCIHLNKPRRGPLGPQYVKPGGHDGGVLAGLVVGAVDVAGPGVVAAVVVQTHLKQYRPWVSTRHPGVHESRPRRGPLLGPM